MCYNYNRYKKVVIKMATIDVVTDRFQITKVSQKVVGSEPKADFNALFKSEGYRFVDQISKMLKNNDINNKEFQKQVNDLLKQYSDKIDANTSKITANSARIGKAENNIQLTNLSAQYLRDDLSGLQRTVNYNSQNIGSLTDDVSLLKNQTSSLSDKYAALSSAIDAIDDEVFQLSELGSEGGNDSDLQTMSRGLALRLASRIYLIGASFRPSGNVYLSSAREVLRITGLSSIGFQNVFVNSESLSVAGSSTIVIVDGELDGDAVSIKVKAPTGQILLQAYEEIHLPIMQIFLT
nr:MAG TPA: hypothetical protein [Caudoviricetes sp.]